jgi:hypothetical protein
MSLAAKAIVEENCFQKRRWTTGRADKKLIATSAGIARFRRLG